MTRSIWKYPCPKPGDTNIYTDMYLGDVVAVQVEDGNPFYWVEVAVGGRKVDRMFMTIGTGHSIPDNAVYCGTWQEPPFVWHLYELF